MAVNAVFAVCLDRRDDFLAQFHNQVEKSIEQHLPIVTGSGNIIRRPQPPPTLLQTVLGEDIESPGTFHCHLKFECSSLQDAQDAINIHNNDPRSHSHNHHAVFLNGASQGWRDFETTNPFQPDSSLEVHVWIVAPQNPASPDILNPKYQSRPTSDGPQTPLFCLNANLYIQPQHREELLAVLEHARLCSIQEPLCVEYQYGESMTHPNTFHVHQAYQGAKGGKEGFDAHAKTQHYQNWKEFAAQEPFTQSPIGYPFRAPVRFIQPTTS